MSANERLTTTPRDRVCRVCGCTDSEACDTALGPCAWAATYDDDHTGICTACDVDFVDDDALPVHHLDDDVDGRARGVCPHSGQSRDSLGGCPRGCSGANEHYSNDGHRDCHDPEPVHRS